MIEHVYRRAADARGVDAVVVATDDERIFGSVAQFGGIARMTRSEHHTGTDRIAEVARDLQCEFVINVQGDEPLVRPDMIEQAIGALSGGAVMSTLRRAISDVNEYSDPNVVKVVVDLKGDALYFSRSPIPFVRDAGGPRSVTFKHIGLYGYRREFLLSFAAMPQTALEVAESLEQLRALEHGYRIRTVETVHDSIGVDTPEDLDRARRQLLCLTTAAQV
jgi:3-deoxy-manno-octulosonate cytidylyltransferase (CMP-KDO synthetase)